MELQTERKKDSKIWNAQDTSMAKVDFVSPGERIKEVPGGDEETETETEAEAEKRRLGYGPCEVCGKEKDHATAFCPYLECIPKGEEGNVLEDGKYGLACIWCGLVGGHPEAGDKATVRACLKWCSSCHAVGKHFLEDCPEVDPGEREGEKKVMAEVFGCYGGSDARDK